MGKRVLKAVAIVMITIPSIFYGCKKDGKNLSDRRNDPGKVIAVADAKRWYESLPEARKKPSGKGYLGTPDWEHAFPVSSTTAGGILKVPLENFNAPYDYRDILFQQQTDGTIQAEVLHVALSPEYLEKKAKEKPTEASNLRSLVDNADFSGYLFHLDLKGNFVDGRIYEGGTFKKAIIPDNSGRRASVETDCSNPVYANSPDCRGRIINLPPVTITAPPVPPPQPSPWPLPTAPGGPGGPLPIGGGTGSTPTSANFKMSEELQKKYPRLTEMVKGLHEYVKNNKNVMDALVKLSGLSEKEVLKYTQLGQGPEIILSDKIEGFGRFNDSKPNELLISKAYANGLEAAVLPGTKQATAFLLAVSTLHEFVHWGRFFEGLPQRGPGGVEMGWEFERVAFKTVISELNAGKYSIEFYKNK